MRKNFPVGNAYLHTRFLGFWGGSTQLVQSTKFFQKNYLKAPPSLCQHVAICSQSEKSGILGSRIPKFLGKTKKTQNSEKIVQEFGFLKIGKNTKKSVKNCLEKCAKQEKYKKSERYSSIIKKILEIRKNTVKIRKNIGKTRKRSSPYIG